MSNNINVTPGTGKTVATEEVSSSQYQQVKLVDGRTGSVTGLTIFPDGSAKVSVIGSVSVSQSGTWITSISGTPSISGTVGSSVLGTVPVTQSGSWATSVVGSPLVTYLAPKASWISAVTSTLTGVGLTSVLNAAGTSIKNYVTHIMVTNAASVATIVDIKDGGGAVIYSGFAAASGGGFSSNINPPVSGSANKSVDAQPRAQASIIVVLTGYTDT